MLSLHSSFYLRTVLRLWGSDTDCSSFLCLQPDFYFGKAKVTNGASQNAPPKIPQSGIMAAVFLVVPLDLRCCSNISPCVGLHSCGNLGQNGFKQGQCDQT